MQRNKPCITLSSPYASNINTSLSRRVNLTMPYLKVTMGLLFYKLKYYNFTKIHKHRIRLDLLYVGRPGLLTQYSKIFLFNSLNMCCSRGLSDTIFVATRNSRDDTLLLSFLLWSSRLLYDATMVRYLTYVCQSCPPKWPAPCVF